MVNYPVVKRSYPLQTTYEDIVGYFGGRDIIETPESVLAKIIPSKTKKLLDNYSKREHYAKTLDIGASVVNVYMKESTPNGVDEIEKVTILPHKKFGWSGGVGMEISFKKR